VRILAWLALSLLASACSSQSTNDTSTGGSGGSGGGSGGSASGGVAGADPAACADGSVEQTYGADMVGCDGGANQCLAEQLCGTGWHLCPYSEYVARGGAEFKATSERWLRACVREAGDDTAMCPSEVICQSCQGGAAQIAIPLTWACDTGSAQAPVEFTAMGLTTSPQSPKLAPGCPEAECSYVLLTGSQTVEDLGATCCRD
jgi:hypothetical protein